MWSRGRHRLRRVYLKVIWNNHGTFSLLQGLIVLSCYKKKYFNRLRTWNNPLERLFITLQGQDSSALKISLIFPEDVGLFTWKGCSCKIENDAPTRLKRERNCQKGPWSPSESKVKHNEAVAQKILCRNELTCVILNAWISKHYFDPLVCCWDESISHAVCWVHSTRPIGIRWNLQASISSKMTYWHQCSL